MTPLELRRWIKRAETIHAKASELFSEIDASGDPDLTPLAGDTLASVSELLNNLEGRLDTALAALERDRQAALMRRFA